ncbi:MAG: hypothetical protein JWS12_183 [Candidatus Saccharibacteria bacterium]|nr:hypothetical protein [Candidatus Saccharibacteria bacterium]
MKKNEQGFSVVEALLIVVIVAVIGAVGWYVYRAQKNTTKTYNTAAQAQTGEAQPKKPTPKPPAPADITAGWKLFTSAKLGYTIRIPDGWTLLTDPASGILMSGKDTTGITYKAGTMATVTEQQIGDDASHPFVLAQGAGDDVLSKYTNQGTVKAANVTGTKYYYLYATDPDVIGPSKGTKEYRYHFMKGQTVLDVTYSILPGDKDNTTTVEKAIATFSIN